MDFYDVVRSRRSIRAYKPDAVPDDVLDRVLEAARLAPSACNIQPTQLYVVRSADKRAALGASYGQAWFTGAPVIICACARPGDAWCRGDGKSYADVDVAIALDHLTLAAAAEGLGTCWIGAFQVAALRSVLELPPHLDPVAMTPLGWPAESPEARPRKPLSDMVEYL